MGGDGANGRRGPTLVLVAALAVLAAGLQIAAQGDPAPFRYQRDLILGGAYWRLFSGQLVHLNTAHLLMNLTGLGLILALFWRQLSLPRTAALLLASLLATGLGLLLAAPAIHWYVGLSGALHGLFAGAAILAVYQRERGAALAAGLLLFKLAAEALWGSPELTGELIQGAVIVEAHRFGALGGALLGSAWVGAGLWRARRRW